MTSTSTNLNASVSKNKFLAVIAYTARVVALMFASGTLIQTLLGVIGYNSRMIYVHSTLIQSANILAVVLCSRMANGIGKTVIRRSAIAAIPTGLIFLLYIPFSTDVTPDLKTFICLAAIGAIQQLFVGLSTVYEYKIPYYIYRAEEYGRMLAICGIISSVASLIVGAVISSLSTKYPYTQIMAVGFVASFLLMAIVFISTLCQKDISCAEECHVQAPSRGFRDIIRYPAFYKLIPANLFRGFATGAIGVLAATALELGYDETHTATMVVLQSVASLSSCACFAIKPKGISHRATLLLGCCFAALTPFLMIKSDYLFLGLYTAIIFGRTLVDYAVPSLLRQIISVDMAAPYNAWRMVLHNAGLTAATLLATVMSVPVLLITTAACQLVSGIVYYSKAK